MAAMELASMSDELQKLVGKFRYEKSHSETVHEALAEV
jgi:hypothetical protein